MGVVDLWMKQIHDQPGCRSLDRSLQRRRLRNRVFLGSLFAVDLPRISDPYLDYLITKDSKDSHSTSTGTYIGVHGQSEEYTTNRGKTT